jgi:hypothetical protein
VQPSFAAFQRRWPRVATTLCVADSHADSTIAAARQAGPYALIHIDGDHSYEGALADLDDYSPLLLPDGLLVVDGIHWDEPVADAVQSFLEQHPQWDASEMENFGFGNDALLRRAGLATP